MIKLYRILPLILGLFFLDQSAYAQLSTVGKEFWVGFMENNRIIPNAPDQAVIVISANEDATGVIEYLGRAVDFSINQGQQFTHTVPSDQIDLLHRGSGSVNNKGVHITSNGKISVYAFNERFRSADGTVVLPIGALGKDYFVTSHYETLTVPVNYDGNVDDESTLLIVATEDDTEIEITTPVQSISGNNPNTPSTITLNSGQSYQIKAKADLTGSRVRVIGDNADDCKKIAVFGGNKWTSVGNCGAANDHLFQQAYPVNTWGSSFVHVALEGRSSGELVKVLASEDGTSVQVNGANRGTLDQGQFLALEFDADETAKITTDKPASVTVFAKSQECNQVNQANYQDGDPFMITYSPAEQLLKEIRFNALNLPSIVNHYVNIVVPSGTEGATVLDGQNIGNDFDPVPGDPNFSYARIRISQGVHRLANPTGFTAYVYGFGFLESYGFAVGAALENLNFETESNYEFDVIGDQVACLDQEGVWEINPDNPQFTYFVWDFGDGSDPEVGQQVTHTYDSPGEYEISISAALSPNTCDEQEEVTFEVEIFETKGELSGLESVCPDVEELIYKLENTEGLATASFEIEGGEILEEYGDSVLVRWGEANDNARLIANPFSENGCPGEAIILEVTINQQIVAGALEGPEDVCFDPETPHFYTVPNITPGRGYDWEITGGTIQSGQNEPTVEVIWDQPGIVGTLTYTAYSLEDELCEGISPMFEVEVASNFEARVADLQEIGCSGLNSGQIELEIAGGVGPYEIEWFHDANLKDPIARDLEAGTYSVEIRDQLGCLRTLENLEIIQPDPLELLAITPEGTSCFGKPDGKVNIQVIGGTPPYTLNYDGEIEFDGQLELTEVAQGIYDLEVQDANACLIPVSFEVVSPPALEVDVRMEKAACPGGSNGELFAFPAGGVAPYIYTWEDQSGSGNQLLGLPKGKYNVSVLDGSGCVSLGTGEVLERAPEIRMPTGFNPAEDEGIYQGVSNCETQFELWIYNRWGQLIYTGNTGWDGYVDGKEVPGGTYSYLVQYSFALEDKIQVEEKRGTFTLIR